jgi:hypothetical protein
MSEEAPKRVGTSSQLSQVEKHPEHEEALAEPAQEPPKGPPEKVCFDYADLERLYGAVRNLFHLSVSLDLQDQYRRLEARGSTSALTRQGEEAVRTLEAHLEYVKDESDGS